MKEAEKASHTPEPWPEFESVAMKSKVCDMEVVELGRENYNRARACVNACFDMDDDEIAQIMAESKGIGMRLSQKEYAISELNRLLFETVQQREELLSALIGVRNELGQEWSRKAFDKAAEAIAKARRQP